MTFHAKVVIYKKLTWRENVRSPKQTLTHAYAWFGGKGELGPVHTKPISWRNRKGIVRFGLPYTRSRRIRWPKPQTSETTLGGGFKSTRFRFGFVCTPETDWNRKPWRHRPTPQPSSPGISKRRTAVRVRTKWRSYPDPWPIIEKNKN